MIDGEKIRLIALNDECFKLMLKWINDPEMKNLIGTVYPISEYEHKKWFENIALKSYEKIFAIQGKNENQIMGIIGNKNFDVYNRNTEIYVYIGEKENQGNGYGRDAVNTFTEFCFRQLNLHKVYLKVFDYNINAIKCYEKCGFYEEGRLREHLFRNGLYHDIVYMSIIRGKNRDENK